MKLVYIAGLEHSGTTLLGQLLAAHPGALGLGEIASFFSPSHMRNYLARWGHCDDCRRCSCGKDWDECDFWGEIGGLSGSRSDAPAVEKYERLIASVRARLPRVRMIVDSSKSPETLAAVLGHHERIGLRREDVVVVHAVKDVRGFASSVARKAGAGAGLLSHLRTFNWWLDVNRRLREMVTRDGVVAKVSLYERVCANPREAVQGIFALCGESAPEHVTVAHQRSHIAMGNKNFLERNRDAVRYDSRWFTDDTINLAYLIHRRARRFNKEMYLL